MRREIGIDEDAYRALVDRVSGGRTTSSASLGAKARGVLIGELRRLGGGRKGGASKGGGGPARAGSRPLSGGAMPAKARALWLALYHLGEVEDPAESALDSFCHRQTGIQRLGWCEIDQIGDVIEALKAWCGRAGVVWPDTPGRKVIREARARAGLSKSPAMADKAAVIKALWRRLIDLWAMRHGEEARLETWLRKHGAAAPWLLEPAAADQAIEALGAWVRKAKAKAGDAR